MTRAVRPCQALRELRALLRERAARPGRPLAVPRAGNHRVASRRRQQRQQPDPPCRGTGPTAGATMDLASTRACSSTEARPNGIRAAQSEQQVESRTRERVGDRSRDQATVVRTSSSSAASTRSSRTRASARHLHEAVDEPRHRGHEPRRGAHVLPRKPRLRHRQRLPEGRSATTTPSRSTSRRFSPTTGSRRSATPGRICDGNYAGLFRPGDQPARSEHQLGLRPLESLLPEPHGAASRRPHAPDQGVRRQGLEAATGASRHERLRLARDSGEPTNTFGAHEVYGSDEVYILARGSQTRLPWNFSADLQLGYRFNLDKDKSLTVSVDVFNLFNFRDRRDATKGTQPLPCCPCPARGRSTPTTPSPAFATPMETTSARGATWPSAATRRTWDPTCSVPSTPTTETPTPTSRRGSSASGFGRHSERKEAHHGSSKRDRVSCEPLGARRRAGIAVSCSDQPKVKCTASRGRFAAAFAP